MVLSTGTYKSNTVTITHTISSSEAGSLDASSTINVVSDNFNLYNVNVANGFGKGAQAVALTANGNQQGYYGCQFDGYQDTLVESESFLESILHLVRLLSLILFYQSLCKVWLPVLLQLLHRRSYRLYIRRCVRMVW